MVYRKLRMIFLVPSLLFFLFAQQVESRSIRETEGGGVVPKNDIPPLIPTSVSDIDMSQSDGIYADDVTTKRPQIGDLIGGGLQNIFQGLVKAPGQIATRVQGILDGLLRRSTTTPAPAAIP